MAISVDWANTQVITIPRADMAIVQVSPEIRQLDANTLHQDLRTLEADVFGRPFQRTHDHNGEIVLSGITYGRAVEIIPPYTVSFEDGQYGVLVVGGNTNLLDVKVANQVSLLGNNSAGLINLPDLPAFVAEGRVIAGSTTEEIRTDRTEADGYWEGVIIQVEDAFGGQAVPASVLAYTNTNGAFFPAAPLPFAPAVGARVRVLPDRGRL